MADMAALVARLESVADRLEKVGGSGGGGGGDTSAFVDEFDALIAGSLAEFLVKSKSAGGDVATCADMVASAFAAQRAFLVVASQSKKPSMAEFGPLLADTAAKLGAVGEFKEANRRSKQFNHLAGVAEGIPCLGWVQVEPKPAPFVKEMLGSAQFYTNRVIKEFKETDKTQVEWARSWCKVISDLEEYVKNNHLTGLTWNPKGGVAAAPTAAAPAAGGGPPPPPGGAPAPPAPIKAAASSGGGDSKASMFAELSKGGAITSGLKKVDKSQMTHKNPEIRGHNPVVIKKKAPAKVFGASAVKKDPVFELNGKKWAVEYQEGNKNIMIETEGVNQTIYAFKCNNSTIQVKGKVNAITLDGCKKCAIVFDTCVAAFEMINCQSVQVQVAEKVRTISIDKTDGALIYLSKDCMDAEIITAKSSEMNVSLPIAEDGQFVEMPIPEQYKTTFNPETKKLETLPTDIAG